MLYCQQSNGRFILGRYYAKEWKILEETLKRKMNERMERMNELATASAMLTLNFPIKQFTNSAFVVLVVVAHRTQ